MHSKRSVMSSTVMAAIVPSPTTPHWFLQAEWLLMCPALVHHCLCKCAVVDLQYLIHEGRVWTVYGTLQQLLPLYYQHNCDVFKLLESEIFKFRLLDCFKYLIILDKTAEYQWQVQYSLKFRLSLQWTWGQWLQAPQTYRFLKRQGTRVCCNESKYDSQFLTMVTYMNHHFLSSSSLCSRNLAPATIHNDHLPKKNPSILHGFQQFKDANGHQLQKHAPCYSPQFRWPMAVSSQPFPTFVVELSH